MKKKFRFFNLFFIYVILTLWGYIFANKDLMNVNKVSFSLIKILVSVAAFWTPGRNLEYLFRLLDEYELSYPTNVFSIHVLIDTNSKELAKILSNRRPTQHTREVRVWSLEELGGDPEYLPHKHRPYWEDREDDFDFFIFTEDDILFTREAFEVYVERRKTLQSKGWTFGWIRVETWGVDNETLVALDNVESRASMLVFETPDGLLWSEPSSPYTAHYVLDRDELRKMIEDKSKIWLTGFPAIDKRANIAMGYNFKYSGSLISNPFGAKGWQSRALVPISRDCKVEQTGGIVRHLPSKYAKGTTLITNNDCIEGGPQRWGPNSIWSSGSNLDCKWGRISLNRVFLCSGDVHPLDLPEWPQGAKTY